MFRLVAASLLLSLCSVASYAMQTTYEWTIDWTQSADQSGMLVFDDLGDNSPRTFNWIYYGAPPPSNIQGLPPGFGAQGSLTFDGSFVSRLRGCNDIETFCSTGGIVISGFTLVEFSLSGNSSATRASYVGGPTGCAPASSLSSLPPNCFAFESGITTFAVATPLTPVPEPSAWALLLAGLAGLALYGRRPTQEAVAAR
jgi:PEP-CTERM motif